MEFGPTPLRKPASTLIDVVPPSVTLVVDGHSKDQLRIARERLSKGVPLIRDSSCGYNRIGRKPWELLKLEASQRSTNLASPLITSKAGLLLLAPKTDGHFVLSLHGRHTRLGLVAILEENWSIYSLLRGASGRNPSRTCVSIKLEPVPRLGGTLSWHRRARKRSTASGS